MSKTGSHNLPNSRSPDIARWKKRHHVFLLQKSEASKWTQFFIPSIAKSTKRNLCNFCKIRTCEIHKPYNSYYRKLTRPWLLNSYNWKSGICGTRAIPQSLNLQDTEFFKSQAAFTKRISEHRRNLQNTNHTSKAIRRSYPNASIGTPATKRAVFNNQT